MREKNTKNDGGKDGETEVGLGGTQQVSRPANYQKLNESHSQPEIC